MDEHKHFFIWYPSEDGIHYCVCRRCGISYFSDGSLRKEANFWAKKRCIKK